MKTFNLVLLSCLFSLHAFAGEPRTLSEEEWVNYQEKEMVIFRFLCADSLQQSDSLGVLKVEIGEEGGLRANCTSGIIAAEVKDEFNPLSSLTNEIVSEIGAFLIEKELDLKSLYVFKAGEKGSIVLEVHAQSDSRAPQQILFQEFKIKE